MKPKIILIIAVLSTGLWACQKSNVTIEGEIIGDNFSRIEYTIPVNGIFSGLMSDTVIIDEEGHFRLDIPLEKQGFILFRPYFKTAPVIRTEGFVIAEPGEKYQVSFDSAKNKDNFQVKGKYENAISLYNKMSNQPQEVFSLQEQFLFSKDSVASSIQKKIKNKRDEEIAIFKDLYEKGEIPREFFNLVCTDRFCYFSKLAALSFRSKYFVTKAYPDMVMTGEQAEMYKFKDDMFEAWKSAFQIPDSIKQKIYTSPWWNPYYEEFIYFELYSNDELTPIKEKELIARETDQTFLINSGGKKYLIEFLLESYFANVIYSECFLYENQNFEMISLYDQFITDYPNSGYTRYLTPYINEIRNYHKIAELDFSENVKFVDNYQEINSLEECIDFFEGKKVYVDKWATWCGSCRAEFSKKEQLNQILKANGIEMLYISTDDDKHDKNWKDLIKYYDLEGYHVRANNLLAEDFEKIQISEAGSAYYPWHIMFNEDGNMMEIPQEIKNLYEEQ